MENINDEILDIFFYLRKVVEISQKEIISRELATTYIEKTVESEKNVKLFLIEKILEIQAIMIFLEKNFPQGKLPANTMEKVLPKTKFPKNSFDFALKIINSERKSAQKEKTIVAFPEIKKKCAKNPIINMGSFFDEAAEKYKKEKDEK